MMPGMRESGIDVISNVPWGTHFGLFYKTKQDLIDFLVPYFVAGLKNNEFCMWVTAEPLNVDEAKALMAEDLPDFDVYMGKGQIEFIPYTEWYEINGVFDGGRVLAGYVEKLRKAQERGFSGLRMMGDISWLEPEVWKDFIDYEQMVNDVIGQHDMLAACSYSLDKCDANDILDVVGTYQFALTRRNGEWKIIEDQEHKKAWKALQESEIRFQSLIQNSSDIIRILDRNGLIIFDSMSSRKILGYPPGYTLGKSPYDFIHPDDLDRVRNDLGEVYDKTSPGMPTEFRVRKADGEYLDVETVGKNMIGVPGVDGIVITTRDITERKRMERELKLMQFSVEKASDEIFWMDSNGRVIYVNDATCNILGYSRAELLSMYVWDFDPTYSPEIWSTSFNDLKKKGFFTFETKHKTREGLVFPVEITANYVEYDGKAYSFSYVRDITERKRAEEALRESEEKFRVLAEMSSAIIYVYQGENLVYVNDAAQRISGYSRDELLKMKFWDIFHPDFKELAKEYGLARQLDQQDQPVPSLYEVKLITKSGETRRIEVTAGRIMYMGKPAGVATFFDITDRKHTEEALRESEEKFRVLSEMSSAVIYVYQGENPVYVNDAAQRISGYSKDEMLKMKFWELVHPDFKELVKERGLARQRGEHVPSPYEIKFITKRGETRRIEITAGRIMYMGKPAGVTTLFDITERKQAEEELKKNRWILAKSQQIAHVGNWALNLQTNKLSLSDEGYRILGYDPGEVQPSLELFISRIHPDDRHILIGSIEEARTGDKLYNIDYRIFMQDGSIRYVNSLADRIKKDSKGNPKWMYGIHQDITRRKQIEKELEYAKSQAELYVDLMGHDINNFNQVALGYLELTELKLKDEEVRELISKPLEVIKSSSNLIENVRKLQKSNSGGLRTEAIDLNGVLSELKIQYSNVSGKEINIELTSSPNSFVMANGLIKDVFSNIIGNAIKHSDIVKPVNINIRLEHIMEGEKSHIKVAIEDNGPGIPDEMKKKLFHRFQRGTTKAQGKGLGLYLVRALVEGYHGRVWVEDRVQGDHTKGSRFVIMLPAAG